MRNRFAILSAMWLVTAVAAMICYEEGLFDLSDPVSELIPSFAGSRVLTGGSLEAPETEPSDEPVRIWHLLTHTAGIDGDLWDDTYGDDDRSAEQQRTESFTERGHREQL